MSKISSKTENARIFHLLTEAEPFSDQRAGAISRWVANVVRAEQDTVVLAPSDDGSWGFAAGRVCVVQGLAKYKRYNDRFGRLLRWPIRVRLLRRLLAVPLSQLRAGDTLWVHNRPEFAAALEPMVHRAGARLVLHLHNSHLMEWPETILRAIKADHTVFLTQFLQTEARRQIPNLGPSDVTYSGADTAIFHPRQEVSEEAADETPAVLFVGRLVPEKGVHVLTSAMEMLLRRGVALRAIVLGGANFSDGSATPYMRELKRAAPANVRFDGYCSGPALGEAFRQAAMFCIPSVWQEALGLVVVEAMASGLPVVASRSGGIPELLAGGGGVLVDRGSAMQLADALEMLATDVVLRRQMARKAYDSFRASYTWDVVLDNYRRILNAVREERTVAGNARPFAIEPLAPGGGLRDVPEVSVVIPTRVRPQMLRRAIESVLAQTMQRFEIIVVLDGEDSVTAEVVEQFEDDRIRLLALERSVGGAEARNLGARKARGRYVALLDDDDEWLADKLQAQLSVAEGHAGSNFVVVTQYVYRVEGQADEVWPGRLPGSREPLSEFLFSSRGGFQTSTYLCPRELFLRVPFRRGLKKHQDWDWFLQLAALDGFELLVVPKPLSVYWVPQRSRVSVSGNLDWEFSYRWATSRRALMTRKAYSRFVVKICTRSAMLQKAGPAALLRLLRDLVLLGRPTPFLLVEFMVCVMLPDDLRLRLRPMVQSWRRSHPRPVVG